VQPRIPFIPLPNSLFPTIQLSRLIAPFEECIIEIARGVLQPLGHNASVAFWGEKDIWVMPFLQD
jgi:hypothetical protein